MSARRVALAAGAWLLVVVLGSWLVWTVISSAGQDFTGDRGALLPAPGQVGQAESAVRPGATPSPSPAVPSVRAAPGSTPASTPSSTAGPAATERPPSPATPERPAEPATRSRTWTGPAGVVTTRCTGSRIELAGAAASADGYVVEVKDRGPREVDVEFEGRGEETVPETRVRARCVDGLPDYEIEAED